MSRSPFAVLFAAAALSSGCAHKALAGADLDRVHRPAFISRIELEAGPRPEVFSEDSAYKDKLKKLDPKEADRRLKIHLAKGMSRFEVAERLRAATFALLPREVPWTNTVAPVAVATRLQAFLVEEVPANPPDYDLLREDGADAIVEFVIEKYGMRSENGHAGVFAEGYGRMFMLDGRSEIWYRSFRFDQVDASMPHLDPFRVAKDETLFRTQMSDMLDAVAAQFAKDLSPTDRRGGAAVPPGNEDANSAADDTNTAGKDKRDSGKADVPQGDDLPSPDAPTQP